MNIADSLNQITFETKSVERMDGRTDHYVIAACPADFPSELVDVLEALNDLGARFLMSQWDAIRSALDGEGKLPFRLASDSMEVTIESDGTWFREQEEWRRSDGAKLPNKEAKKLLSRFIEAEKRA